MGMSQDEIDRRYALGQKAAEVWNDTHRGRVKPTTKQKDILIDAYWAGSLPRVKDYCLYQWVEDGCPAIV
jgi:hypothetical protein